MPSQKVDKKVEFDASVAEVISESPDPEVPNFTGAVPVQAIGAAQARITRGI